MGGVGSSEAVVIKLEPGKQHPWNALMAKYGYPTCNVTTGGDESNKEIIEHLEGKYSKTKELYVRDIAQAITELGFGKGKVDPKDPDFHHLAKAMMEVVPGPKSGMKFKEDAAMHSKVCQAIAKVLNEKFTPGAKTDDEKLINMSWSPDRICYRVSELIEALSTGMHSEFLGIWGQVRQNLKNMVMLKESLEKVVQELASKCQDAVVLDEKTGGMKTEPLSLISQQAKLLITEIGTQIALVQSLLNTTIDPAEKDMAEMIQADSQQWKLAKRIGMIPGTAEFSPALAGITQGIVSTAALAAEIDKAFKKIKKEGKEDKVRMTAEEFLRLGRDEMKKSLDTIERDTKEPAVMVQVKELRRLYNIAQDKGMNQTTGGAGPTKPAGGDEDRKSDLDKRVAKQRAERLVLLEEFIRKTTTSYQQMVSGIMEMAPELGKRIPITDKLSDFKNAIIRSIDLNQEDINVALIGFNLDAMAREKRETFISSVRYLISTIDEVMAMSVYKSHEMLFAKIKSAANELLRTIDQFSDIIKKKYGGEEMETIGGDVIGYLRAEDMPKYKQNVINIRAAAKKFQYFFYIAKFKENVERTSSELDSYGENYVNVLADAVGGRRMQLQREKNLKLEDIETNGIPADKDKLKEYVKKSYEVKDRFYKTLEAVDLYLKGFTKALTSNIDDIKDIKRILDGVEFITDFYREIAGDNLTYVFDSFAVDVKASPPVRINNPVATIGKSSHYYENVVKAPLSVGVPYLGVSADKHTKIRTFLDKFFDNFTALKNIIDVFFKIGEKIGTSSAKIGGLDMKQSTFMSPTEIYKNLTEYLKMSSTTLGVEGPGLRNIEVGDTKAQMSYDHAKDAAAKYSLFMSMIDGFDTHFTAVANTMTKSPLATDTGRVAAAAAKDAAIADEIKRIPDLVDKCKKLIDEVRNRMTDIDTLSADIKNNIPDPTKLTAASQPTLASLVTPGGASSLDVLKGDYRNIGAGLSDLRSRPFPPSLKTSTEVAAETNKRMAEFKTLEGRYQANGATLATSSDVVKNLKIEFGIRDTLMKLGVILATHRASYAGIVNDAKSGSATAGASLAKQQALDAQGYDIKTDAAIKLVGDALGFDAGRLIRNHGNIETNITDSTAPVVTLASDFGKSLPAGAPVIVYPGAMPLSATVYVAIGGTRGNPTVTFDPARGKYINGSRTEDIYFYLMIKAMAAKVLTIVGVYDIFDRYNVVSDITPIRQIVGGGEESLVPEVLPEAAELYFRLIRLAEFYVDFLRFKKTPAAPADKAIVLIPELDGEFTELIKQIFLRGQILDTNLGDYSDYELREIVRSVNNIYLRYKEKAGDKANSAAVEAFIKEINRRYGIVKGSEWNKYTEFIRSQRKREYELMGSTDYLILPGEGEPDYPRISPSDRFVSPLISSTGELRPGKYDLDTASPKEGKAMAYYDMLIEFRKTLQEQFQNVISETKTDVLSLSYSPLIKQAQSEISKGKTPYEKYEVVKKLILGSGIFIGADTTKTFMFHETVVYGLNVLNSVYTILNGFKMKMMSCDVKMLQDTLSKALDMATPPIANKGTLTTELKNSYHANLQGDMEKFIIDDTKGAYMFYGRGGFADTASGDSQVGLGIYRQLNGTINSDKKPAAMRFLINAQAIMEFYLSNLFMITSNFQGLVDVKFYKSGSLKVHLDFSKLRDFLERTMQNIKHYMDVFRPFIKKEILDKYESAGTPGSLYWLDRELMDKLVKGLPSTEDTKISHLEPDYMTLDRLTNIINTTFVELTKKTTVSGQEIDLSGALIADFKVFSDPKDSKNVNKLPEHYYEHYGNVLSKFVFYDATSDKKDWITVGAKNPIDGKNSNPLENLITTGPATGTPPVAPLPTTETPAATQRISVYSLGEGFTNHRSLMFMFNQILAKYLKQFYDTSTGKIYQNLINSFANGVFSSSLTAPNNRWVDIILGTTNKINQIADPKATSVLFSSLAMILRRLTRDINQRTQASEHLVNNLTDIPLYMKENYRANLPIFMKLFDGISKLADFLKNIIQKTDIMLGKSENAFDLTGKKFTAASMIITNPVAGALGAMFPQNYSMTPTNFVQLGLPLDDGSMKVSLTGIIDIITSGSYTLSGATTDVIKELADEPKFFQTNEGSIDTYKNRTGKFPLMPISLTAFVLTKDNPVDKKILSPDYNLGDPKFKYNYGTRGVFNKNVSQVTWDKMPGVKLIVDAYNSSLQKRDQVDPDKYLKYVNDCLSLLKYSTDISYYFSNLIPESTFTLDSTQLLRNVDSNILSYESNKQQEITSILDIVESSDQDAKITEVSKLISSSSSSSGSNRHQERILNIVELNVSPINVHALMREIPLVNVYNYAYTLDQLAEELLGGKMVDDPKAISLGLRTAKDAMLNLIGDPYIPLSQEMYGNDARIRGSAGVIHRLFVGDHGVAGLGRPKFLSDQIFNKSLFGNLMPEETLKDVSYPTSSAASRGRDGWDNGTKSDVDVKDWDLSPSDRKQNLTYAMISDGKVKFNTVKLPGTTDVDKVTAKSYLQVIGKSRFDTKLIRNIFFIMNVWRLLRLKLDRELTQFHSVITRGNSLVNPSLTEYDQDRFGEYETAKQAKNEKYLETRKD